MARPAGVLHAADEAVGNPVAGLLMPLGWVWLTVVLAGLWFAGQTYLAASAPSLGIELSHDDDDPGLTITHVYPGQPAARAGLAAGDTLLSISAGDREIVLSDYLTLFDPDTSGSYQVINDFQRDARAVTAMLAAGAVVFDLADGERVEVEPAAERPLANLPLWYWAISVMGIVALAIGVGLKAHTPGNSDTTLVLVAAIGFWLTAWSWPLYGPRELAVPVPGLLGTLEAVNHLGFVVLLGAALALLWQYPTRLGRGSAAPAFLGVGLLIWLAMTFQWFEFPGHAFYVPLFCLPLIPGAALAVMQVRTARNRPVEKASLRWLLITIFGSTCGAFALYAVPPLFGTEPMAPPWLSQFVLLLFFIGLALGAARYRLFDVERWWLNTWLWFAMGAAIVLVDVSLIALLNLGAGASTAAAVLLIGWVYFPVRQWVWQRVAQAPERSPWQIMPELARRFARPLRPEQAAGELAALLESLFDASDTLVLETPSASHRPRLTRHGLSLAVPVPENGGQVLVTGKARGQRLFSQSDVRFVATLLDLVAKLLELARERDTAERRERDRIMRDLHDDVGARLLSLVHGARDPEVRREAAATLETLRTSVIPLHDHRATPVSRAAEIWRAEVERRGAEAGIRMRWHQRFDDPPPLSPRQYVNLTRILRELLTNAIKHAEPSWVEAIVTGGIHLELVVRHDGRVRDPDTWHPNTGLHSLNTRAAEISASVDYRLHSHTGARELEARVALPL